MLFIIYYRVKFYLLVLLKRIYLENVLEKLNPLSNLIKLLIGLTPLAGCSNSNSITSHSLIFVVGTKY